MVKKRQWAVMRMKISWTAILALIVGAFLGTGIYTFVYARGASYLANDPSACANCHVMGDVYSAWMKSSHHATATCNDCHTPHDLVGKYTVKALNGFSHSLAFTAGDVPDNIVMKPGSARVVEGACRSCHAALVESVDGPHSGQAIACIRCHADVGHSAAGSVTNN